MVSDEIKNLHIEDITFHHNRWVTTRVRNVLQQNGIHTLGQLLECTLDDLNGMRNFGAISAANVVAKLDSMGLKLKEPGW